MHMATELDAGDIITQAETAIDPDEDAETLYQRLADMGGALLISAVEQLAAGTATRTPQEAAGVTLAPMLGRELSPIDWKRSAQEIHNQVRGLIPWPTATTDAITGDTMKILVTQQTGEQTGAPAGTVVAAGKQGIDMACGDGKILRIVELQAAGKKRMKAADYLRGNPISIP